MTIRQRLTVGYLVIAGLCLALLAGLAYHEFVTEPRERRASGVPELQSAQQSQAAEIFFYIMFPVVLGCGWWMMRRMLAPIGKLAQAVELVQAHNLSKPLPRSFRGDEVDRLTEVFNSLTARLDLSLQKIREFTLHASHELKTPLTLMRGQLETMLREENRQPPGQAEWVHSHLDEVQRLSKIVDALSLLTKADTGLLALERESVRLADLVKESFEDAQILAEPADVKVILEQCADEAVVFGDRHRLRQLLLNLADNAIKYNEPGGLVTMSLRREGTMVNFQITNTGQGISPEVKARIFERFVRGDEARTKAIEGCGLGLSICQAIVRAHEGTIEISSPPGKRTTVTVRLPLAKGRDELREQGQPSGAGDVGL